MKYAALVTLYNPSTNDIKKISEYINAFDRVYIYDNSSNNDAYKSILPTYDKLSYFFNGVNDGLCKAINNTITFCIKEEIDFLCTLDQDSQFDNNNISKIKELINSAEISDVALVVPKVVYNGKDEPLQNENDFEEVSFAISSGTFLNITLLAENTDLRYDEYYFLDRFEKDFCRQVYLKGYHIKKCNNSILRQSLGELKNGYTTHNAIRHYYMFRNRFYYNKKFHNQWEAAILNILQTLRHITYILRAESDKKTKLSMCKYGYLDYKRNHGGRKIW